MSGPTDKRTVSLYVHLLELLEEIEALQNDAYREMGGKTKTSLSGQLNEAAEQWIKEFVKTHGPLPEKASERADYVKRMARANLASLKAPLARPTPQ